MEDAPAAANARELWVSAGEAPLYVREVGKGRSVLVVHGGPDFDHRYLVPELDRLGQAFRIVYYDQRGRGRSFTRGRPSGVTMASEVADLERIRRRVASGAVALIGHSWGVLVVLEYAIRHPEYVKRAVLMNSAPVSFGDAHLFRASLRRLKSPEQAKRMEQLRSHPRFAAGDVELEAEYLRIHYRATVPNDAVLADVVGRLRTGFSTEGIVAARAIEDALLEETWSDPGYDLVPALRGLQVPVLLIHGERDFVPVEVARRIADALPRSRLELIAGSGHFALVEQPERIVTMIATFLDEW